MGERTDAAWRADLEAVRAELKRFGHSYHADKGVALRKAQAALSRLEARLEGLERKLAESHERERTNHGTVTRVLATETRLRKTLEDVGRWLGHPAEATDSDVQLVIHEIEHTLADAAPRAEGAE